jgi:DNA-binding IclR family transcriptional regulator
VGTASSPPTQRVVAVIEHLLNSEKPLTATQLATMLNIARPTLSAVLSELERAGWVHRDRDRSYGIGRGFPALKRASATDGGLADVLTRLSRQVDCGLTLSAVQPDCLVVLHKVQSRSRTIRGLPVGKRIPMSYPTGAAVMAFRGAEEQRAWFSGSTNVSVPERRRVLRTARQRKVVIYRPTEEDAGLVDVLIDLLDAAGEHAHEPRVQQRVFTQMNRLISRTYGEDEIDGDVAGPISYLTTPVFDTAGRARYEIELAPLRADVTREERGAYIAAALTAAEALGDLDILEPLGAPGSRSATI